MEMLRYDVASPGRLEAEGEAVLVTAPGVEGDFGAMWGHAPFLSLLRAGALRIEGGDGSVRVFYVRGGVATARGDRVTVLVEDALDLGQADREALSKRLADAEDDLEHAEDGSSRRAAAEEERDYVMGALAALDGD